MPRYDFKCTDCDLTREYTQWRPETYKLVTGEDEPCEGGNLIHAMKRVYAGPIGIQIKW